MAISREAQAMALYREMVRGRFEESYVDGPILDEEERSMANRLAKLSLELVDIFLSHIPPPEPK